MTSVRCDNDPNKCRSQVALNRLLKDPVLGPFVRSRRISEQDKSSAQKIGGYGWISLPTTAANGTNQPKKKLNAKNDVINFFAIKRYSPEESRTIYDALSNSMSSGKGTGRDIVFDKNGNFACWDGETNKILRNPIIPPNMHSEAHLAAGVKGTGETNNTLFNTHNKFIVGTNIYFYNEKMIVNPKLTYIILTRDDVPSENSVYYLVYNPMHRKKFQEYYTHLISYDDGIWRGNKLLKATNRGYQSKDVTTVPSARGGPGLNAPSYINVAARYCNALKIGGDALPNGRPAEHYADPTCNFILEKDNADLALIMGKNYTQSNLVYDRFAAIKSTEAEAKKNYERSKGIFLTGPGNSQLHWPCKDSHPKDQETSLSFAEKEQLLWENSKSFVNVLGNAYVNNFGSALANENNALNIGGENFNKSPGCKARALNITSCTNVVEIAGDAEGNDISMQAACGMQVPEEEEEEVVKDDDNVRPPIRRPGNQFTEEEEEEEKDNTMLYIIIAAFILFLIAMVFLFFK